MGVNPLLASDGWGEDPHAQRLTFERLQLWCDENNQRPMFRDMGRWFYVDTIKDPSGSGPDRNEIRALEGPDGLNARKLIRGQLQDFNGWSERRMDGYRAWLRSCLRRGMTPDRYAELQQKGLGL
ncbi:MAG: hypothetical protein CMH85_01285 [Novosphingobium sp.]|nr:hypothetical protein [Novosphingobium sp.]|tara:strand:- start:406 stop:780 length:375 start_codon:yes stop_codon:yes gene_type:complete